MTTQRALAFLVATAFSGLGVALAQEGAAEVQPSKEVTGGQDVSLTPEQMLQRVRVAIPEMDRSRATVVERLADAKKKKDVVRALCLDDKSRQMKVATDTAKERAVDLASAASLKNADRLKHEYTVVQVLRERVRTLEAEAQQCIGEETGFVGDSKVIVEIDPALPGADPSDFPDDSIISQPPVLSSPTL